MSYVVLARKWRSQHFEEVVGQGHVARTLKNSIAQDRVAHAYLFTGARGVGKTSTARILAKALNCAKGPTATPCYQCSSCLEISSGQAVDVFEIDGASNRGINEIRDLREGVRYAPQRDRFKVYIIDEVHMLTTEAFNALLKTLEEPPSHVKFIFATTEPQKIPVTILSRCQRFDFKRISQHDIVEHLKQVCAGEEIQAEKSALQLIARQANGGMRDALSLLDQVISFAGKNIAQDQVIQILGVANRKHLFEISDAIIRGHTEDALTALDDVHRYGYDLQQFAGELVHHMRDLTVIAAVSSPERITDLTQHELAVVHQQIKGVPAELLHRYFDVMVTGAQEMSRSPYPKLRFEMTIVRLSQLEPLVSIDLLVDQLKALESLLDKDMPLPEAKKKTLHSALIHKRRTEPIAPPKEAHTQTVVETPLEQSSNSTQVTHSARQQTHTTQISVAQISTSEIEVFPPPKEHTLKTPKTHHKPEWMTTEAPLEWGAEYDDEHTTSAVSHNLSSAISDDDLFDTVDIIKKEPMDEASSKASNLALIDTPSSHATRTTLSAPEFDLTRDGPQKSWNIVVAHLRETHAPLAATLEHAHVDSFTDASLEISFIDRFYNFIHDASRIEPLHQMMNLTIATQDGSFDVITNLRESDESKPGEETLAQLRDAEITRRHKVLEDHTRQHPIVEQVSTLFGDGLKMRVRVELREN